MLFYCLDSRCLGRLFCHAYPGINYVIVVMQDKHKVTLYLPPELHRQLKVRSAVELEPMSSIAERALVFYLEHPDAVDDIEAAHGHVHRIYSCPGCSTSFVLREGEATPLSDQAAVADDSLEPVACVGVSPEQHGEETLVPC